jgi:hypothetical protein
MRDVTSCADNLVLFGEMLEVASEYITRCEKTLGHEGAFMIELAHDQISSLRQRVVKMEQRLRELESQLRLQASASQNKAARACSTKE